MPAARDLVWSWQVRVVADNTRPISSIQGRLQQSVLPGCCSLRDGALTDRNEPHNGYPSTYLERSFAVHSIPVPAMYIQHVQHCFRAQDDVGWVQTATRLYCCTVVSLILRSGSAITSRAPGERQPPCSNVAATCTTALHVWHPGEGKERRGARGIGIGRGTSGCCCWHLGAAERQHIRRLTC